MSFIRLQQRATDPIVLGGDVATGDVLQRRAAAERHGDLELVLQHLQRVPHSGLAVHCKGEQHRPADLQKTSTFSQGLQYVKSDSSDAQGNGLYENS